MTFYDKQELIVSLECEGCSDTFEGTAQEAFDLGWDCPPYFVSHVTCPKCPISTTLWQRLIGS